MKRFLTFLLWIGAVCTIFLFEAGASEISSGSIIGQGYFHETFSDKILNGNRVMNNKWNTIWQINPVAEQKIAITDTGALELGNAQAMQRAVLAKEMWADKQNYAMEFTINIQKVGNEPHSGRPIAIIIPRTCDYDFTKYYAITYEMEDTVANQFKFRWAIVNTAAPTQMEPLVKGYYLLQENVDYTARLVIQNNNNRSVNIKFYIDGPINPMKEYKPLLEYTDTSPYKLLAGVTGPAFGMAGYSEDEKITSPVVRYDNITLYDLDQYKKYEEQLKEFACTDPKDIEDTPAYGQIKYLINRGLLSGYSDQSFRPNEPVTVAQFLKVLITLKGEACTISQPYWAENYIKRGIDLGIIKENEISDYNKPITKYDAALMIMRFNSGQMTDEVYASFIKDYKDVPNGYHNAVLYAYYEGYFRLNDQFKFMGNDTISREQTAIVFLRMLDAGYRKINYKLELPSILSNGAVLQGNAKIPVWGRGVCGEKITVSFNRQVKTTVVKNGHWYLELDPEKYGGPYAITVSSTKDTIELININVGEVFIVAGQSNSEMFLSECNGVEDTIKKFIDKPNIRFYAGEKITAVTPNFTNPGTWEPAVDWTLNISPAIGTFFVEHLLSLNKDLSNVTIGIIRMSYGGTTIEAFMPSAITEEQNYVQKDNEPIMSGFWNGFMEPVAPYAVKGVIYYQGENSAHLGYQYEPLLRDYLRGLRLEFQDPQLPIMLVQLAGYGYNNYQNDINEWPKIREVQMRVANTTENTGLVTAVDLADADPIEIHPKEKKEIGRRLAYLAMGLIYHKEIEQRSAELKSYQFRGNRIIVDFQYDFGRIYLKDGAIQQFQVLDRQGLWHPANAVVHESKNTVEIWSDEVQEPAGARYAWVNYPSISLYNNVDLPVLPFRVVNMPKTASNVIKLENHALRSNDGIVNISKGNLFRVIVVIDENTITHEFAVKDQAAGDTILKLARLGSGYTQAGTNETILKIKRHGLSAGDWIRNDTRGWEARRVKRVLDENTIEVDPIMGQSAGDEIDLYKNTGSGIAK